MKDNTSTLVRHAEFNNICQTCGTHYAEESPKACVICIDERQYLPSAGQKWTSYNRLKRTHTIRFNKIEPNVYQLRISPAFGIAQRAHLILSPGGNILWDCLPFLDEATVAFIRSKGGLKCIAISHPHYYGLMASWADTFDCPIYLHKADSEWVMDEGGRIRFFESDKQVLWNGIEIIHTGGHFAGATILHAPAISDTGSVFVGDTLQIAPSRQFISIMYSYPNQIPLSIKEINRISSVVTALNFDSIYGAFEWQNIQSGAKDIFLRSVKRYQDIHNQ
jgi:hypothetical protein